MLNHCFDKRHRDDDYVDEIRVVVRERYKTSGLSGDEWRFHRVMQLYRKGTLLGERAFNGSIEKVAAYVPLAMAELMESGDVTLPKLDHLCFQPGCANVAVSEYELIEEFGRQGEKLDKNDLGSSKHRRRFCAKHLRRGDCGREDSDVNYRVIAGPGPDGADMHGANITESGRMDVRIDNLDQIAPAIGKVRDLHQPRDRSN